MNIVDVILWLGIVVFCICMLTFVWDAIEGIKTYKRDRNYTLIVLGKAPGSREAQVAREAFNRRYPRRSI
jgi:hypothetical protein